MKIIYRTTNGEILAWCNPSQDVELVKQRWPESAWVESKEYPTIFDSHLWSVNLETLEVQKPNS